MTSDYISAADEYPYHQQAQPIAVPVTADSHFNDGYYWGTFADGWYLSAGLRVHPNNNVMDGFIAVVRGDTQRSVRVSRALHPDYALLAVPPLAVEITEPITRHRVQFDHAPAGLAADLSFEARSKPFVESEARMYKYGRLISDVVRYTVVCRATGTITLDGEVTPVDDWYGVRDHSWGVRSAMGPRVPIHGRGERPTYFEARAMRLWVPFEVDGYCGFFHTHEDRHGNTLDFEGSIQYPDGRLVTLTGLKHNLEYVPGSSRLVHGEFTVSGDDGAERTYEVTPVAGPAFGQGFGYAGGWQDGAHHGSWRGESYLEQDEAFDISDAVTPGGPSHVPPRKRIGGLEYACRFRSSDGSSGMGNVEHIYYGPYDRYGIS
jgi:hypothetical protein